jgi:hypothetical protein
LIFLIKKILKMSSKLLVDSIGRDREEFPNPCQFIIPGAQMKGWYIAPKTTRGTPGPKVPQEFYTVTLDLVTIPYIAALTDFRYLQVEFRTKTYDDRYLMGSAHAGGDPETRFILQLDKVLLGSAGASTWIVYKSSGPNVMRLKRKDDLFITIRDPTGAVVTAIVDAVVPAAANPLKQITLVLDIQPYFEDARYTHLEELF